MRYLVVLLMVGMGPAIGCGGSRSEIRTYSSVPIGTPQQQLDGIAANFLNSVTRGLF